MTDSKTGKFCGVLVFAVLIFIFASCNGTEDKKEQGVPLEELYIGEEPGLYPPVLLYRTRKTQWSIEDVERWYHHPTEEEQKELEEIFMEKTESILDTVP